MSRSGRLYIAYDPVYVHPLPEGHRFPMTKYERIAAQLLNESLIAKESLFSPAPCREEIVLLTHTREYLDKLENQTLSSSEQRRIGFTQSPELTRRELIITQGTVDCCRYALEQGLAMNIAGGTHHAFADHGEGFCLLNDFAVGAHFLLKEKKASRILIVDLDVHQGNGTAKIFQGDPRVFTFSMHGRNNYPFQKEKSDLDIELEDGITDDAYLKILHSTLPGLIERVRPDFAFFLSGVDILATDRFGKLKITPDGCRARDQFVFSQFHQNQIPLVVAMGGGYSENIQIIVDAHCETFRQAIQVNGWE